MVETTTPAQTPAPANNAAPASAAPAPETPPADGIHNAGGAPAPEAPKTDKKWEMKEHIPELIMGGVGLLMAFFSGGSILGILGFILAAIAGFGAMQEGGIGGLIDNLTGKHKDTPPPANAPSGETPGATPVINQDIKNGVDIVDATYIEGGKPEHHKLKLKVGNEGKALQLLGVDGQDLSTPLDIPVSGKLELDKTLNLQVENVSQFVHAFSASSTPKVPSTDTQITAPTPAK